MNSETLYDHCIVTDENLETLREVLPTDQARELALGEKVSVYRFPLTGGAHGTITVYWDSHRFALAMGADSAWGDVEEEGGVKLYLDDAPDPVGGPFWIDPELAAWVKGYEFVPFPLDPTEALEVAREEGRDWAGDLDPEEIEDFAQFVSNSCDFPDCPTRETYDAAWAAAADTVFPDED